MRPQSKPFTVETKKRRRRGDGPSDFDVLGFQSGLASLRAMVAEVGLSEPAKGLLVMLSRELGILLLRQLQCS